MLSLLKSQSVATVTAALIGALLGGIGVQLIASHTDWGRESTNWITDQRIQIYSDYVQEDERFRDTLRELGYTDSVCREAFITELNRSRCQRLQEINENLIHIRSRMSLVASTEVLRSIHNFYSVFHEGPPADDDERDNQIQRYAESMFEQFRAMRGDIAQFYGSIDSATIQDIGRFQCPTPSGNCYRMTPEIRDIVLGLP